MNKFALAAIESVKLMAKTKDLSPRIAWERSTTRIMGEGSSSQKKGCPRDAFLGLCEEGLIKGISKGNYCNSVKNKGYALSAVTKLQKNPSLLNNPMLLWDQILEGERKTHNGQMDVVIALWNTDLINPFSE